MKVLFLSRAFPPVTGGIENQNAALAEWLPKHAEASTIANHGGKKSLWWFLPYASVRTLLDMRNRDALLLGDGVLAPLGWLVKILSPRKTVASVVHGLDITFALKKGVLASAYRLMNIPALRSLDHVIAVSRATADVARQAGVPASKVTVIPNGVETEAFDKRHSREELDALLEGKSKGKIVIALFGRYVKRKGTEWFLRNVLPRLPENVFFVVAGGRVKSGTPGDADTYERCVDAIAGNQTFDRVSLLTNVPGEQMEIIRSAADIVVVPNIPQPGTMEGFGMVTIEAASAGRPVVASDLEGLKDAIMDGENGKLVEPENSDAWLSALEPFIADENARRKLGERAKIYTREHYHWNAISKRYIDTLEATQKHK